MTHLKAKNPKNGTVLIGGLSENEAYTLFRKFDTAIGYSNARYALNSFVGRLLYKARSWGDEFKIEWYNTKGNDDYAIFVIITKIKIGEDNPYFKNNRYWKDKRKRRRKNVEDQDL